MENKNKEEPNKALEPSYRTEWVTDNFAIFTAMTLKDKDTSLTTVQLHNLTPQVDQTSSNVHKL